MTITGTKEFIPEFQVLKEDFGNSYQCNSIKKKKKKHKDCSMTQGLLIIVFKKSRAGLQKLKALNTIEFRP